MPRFHAIIDVTFEAKSEAAAYRKLSDVLFDRAVGLGGFSKVQPDPPTPVLDGKIEIREDLELKQED